jgi:hypothetical protein
MSLSFFADGTTFVEPIECDKCGAKACVIRRAPHPHIPHAEVQIFECLTKCGNKGTEPCIKQKVAAEELAEMIRDGLAEEGHDVQVRPNPETGWDVAVISANYAEDAGIRAEAIAAGLRQWHDLEK